MNRSGGQISGPFHAIVCTAKDANFQHQLHENRVSILLAPF
jgi:hypothetical protein